MESEYIESSFANPDEILDETLRPAALNDFSGQESLKTRLSIIITAAKQRNEPLTHLLFYGPPGLGKTTLASILASEMGTKLISTSSPAIAKAGDLAGMMTSLEPGDIFFIDEIHGLNRAIEEYLYPAMEDFRLDLTLDSGPSARTVQVNLNKFTLVGATTRVGNLSAPLRSRFGFTFRLDYYDEKTLTTIILRSAKILKFDISIQGARAIARRSRGTPRVANNILRWVRDHAQIHNKCKGDEQSVCIALEMLAIDHMGLDETDLKILSTIIDHHNGGPVGVKTL
ncbi:MAG: Holliday junction branch migration DNA helicase RuvB, partial [Simkaniaceae bacterium]|nr:Holliday junction branch migration DNA helicase RuvB [Simkaniaceae bacterium]